MQTTRLVSHQFSSLNVPDAQRKDILKAQMQVCSHWVAVPWQRGNDGAVPMTQQETLLDPFQLMEINSKLSNPDKLTLNKKHWHQSYHLNCLIARSEILIENIFMYRFMKAKKIFAWIRRVGLNSASLNYFMVIKHSIQRGSEKALKSTYISWNNFSDLVPLTLLKCLLSSLKKFNLTRLNKIKPWQQFLMDSAYLYNGIMFSNYWPKRVVNWPSTCSTSD